MKFKESGSKIMEVLDRTARLSAPRGSDLPADEAFARWDVCLTVCVLGRCVLAV